MNFKSTTGKSTLQDPNTARGFPADEFPRTSLPFSNRALQILERIRPANKELLLSRIATYVLGCSAFTTLTIGLRLLKHYIKIRGKITKNISRPGVFILNAKYR